MILRREHFVGILESLELLDEHLHEVCAHVESVAEEIRHGVPDILEIHEKEPESEILGEGLVGPESFEEILLSFVVEEVHLVADKSQYASVYTSHVTLLVRSFCGYFGQSLYHGVLLRS